MPAEEFTYTGSDISARVRSQFGDTSGAQLDDASILRWINDGQREIVNSNPILRASKLTNIVASQADYSFPTDSVLVIEAVYVDGYPIDNMTPQAARQFIKTLDPKAAQTAERPQVWYERAGTITFYPVPNLNITNGLKLEYIKNPAPLTALTSSVTIPDRYFNELVTYVLAQSLEMDENYSAAQFKHRQFRDGLDRQNLKDTTSQNALYSGVLPDANDFYL